MIAAAAPGCRAPAPKAETRRAAKTAAAYTDAKVCASCHPGQSKTYQFTGMGRSFASISPALMRAGTYYHAASNRYYTFERRGERYFLRRHQKDPKGKEINVFEAEVHYVVGSGNHSRSYLHRTPDNRLIQLPVSWYSENGGTLAMSPGYDSPTHQDFRRPVSHTCFACHNGYPRGAASGDGYPAQLPEGIDCQRCHGPGEPHVDAAKQGRPVAEVKAAIVNPKRLSGEREMEVCLQCHLETTSFELPNAMIRHGREPFSYRPGEPLGDYQLHFDHAPGTGHDDKFEIAGAAYRLRQSACFQGGSGGNAAPAPVKAMRCTTCHNPHDIPRGAQAVAHYRSACLECHGATLDARHAAQTDCTGCHMPKRRTEDVVHVAMTDHRIVRAVPPRAAGGLLAPRRERHVGVAGQKPYRGEVVLYYPPLLASAADRDLYVALAQVAQGSNLAAGIPRLEAAVRQHRPERAEFYVDLALAYAMASTPAERDKAAGVYREALAKDPRSLAALRGLGSLLVQSGQAPQGVELLETARSLDPNDAPSLHGLARAYRQLGRAPDAIAALEAAVKADPNLTEAWDSLGNMLLETSGGRDRAEQALREAIRRQPDFASAHGNLANALMAKQAYEEAEAEYKQAIALDPALSGVRYNYGAALAGAGRFAEAEAQLKAAVSATPGFAEAGAMLGDLYTRRRAWREAIERYRAALAADARLGRARLGLAIALAASGDFAAARPHLEQTAANDADPRIRQEAAEVLRSLPGSQ